MNTLVKSYHGFPSFVNQFLNEEGVNNSFPLANIIEKEDQFMIELAVPGFKKEDFKVEVTDKQLKISVDQESLTENVGTLVRQEFKLKSFVRQFRLPQIVDTETISAVYDNGILNVTIDKKEEAKPKEPRLISIN